MQILESSPPTPMIRTCETGFEGCIDLKAFGVLTNPGVGGNDVAFDVFDSGGTIGFYGNDNVGMGFTDDGFSYFSSMPGAAPDINAPLPTAFDPNDRHSRSINRRAEATKVESSIEEWRLVGYRR